jgi:hypothetical protein
MMKYVYGSMATVGVLTGVGMLFSGPYANAMLTLIFGACCMVAAEISELSEKLKRDK